MHPRAAYSALLRITALVATYLRIDSRRARVSCVDDLLCLFVDVLQDCSTPLS